MWTQETDTCTGRMPHEHEGRDKGTAGTSQGTSETIRTQEPARGDSPSVSEGTKTATLSSQISSLGLGSHWDVPGRKLGTQTSQEVRTSQIHQVG